MQTAGARTSPAVTQTRRSPATGLGAEVPIAATLTSGIGITFCSNMRRKAMALGPAVRRGARPGVDLLPLGEPQQGIDLRSTSPSCSFQPTPAVKGHASPTLLDTYETERRPVTEALLRSVDAQCSIQFDFGPGRV